MTEHPLFNSAYEAIAFAYRYSSQQYAPTPMARLMRGNIGSGKGLSGLDGAAQAGIIIGMIDHLNELEKAALRAKFCTDARRLEARNMLITPAMCCIPTGIHHRRAVDALVQKHFGKTVKLKEVAAEYGINKNTVTEYWRAIRKTLDNIEHGAMNRAEMALVDAGLCW